MKAKQNSLQEQAKESHSINVNDINYLDYIDEQVKQNQITPFLSQHHIIPSNNQKTELKQLNSNQQSKRATILFDKSTLQSGEIKLCRQRIQILQARLKEKNTQLKFKDEELARLAMLNQELEYFKMQFLLQSSQKIFPTLKETKQVQTEPLPFPQKQASLNYPSKSSFQEQVIELRFQLQKYRKKYFIIEQNLKKRVNDYENQLSSLNRKLKQEKQQSSAFQQQIFTLQQESINLKQKLQEAYEEIQSLQLQKDTMNQEATPSNFNIRHLQNNQRRFSFGDDLKEIGSTNWIQQSKPLFLNIFNEVSYSYAPQICPQTGRFKGETQKKRNAYMIRLYPRMYEIKILGKIGQKKLYSLQQDNQPKFAEQGTNTVRKNLYLAASVNIKISTPSNDYSKKIKPNKHLKICSKQVCFYPSFYLRPKILHKQDICQTQHSNNKRSNTPVNSIDYHYKISSMNNSKSIQKTEMRNQYGKQINQRNDVNSLEKTQQVDLNRTIKCKNINKEQSQISCLKNDKDILQRINHHLNKSPLISPKIQNGQNIPLRKCFDYPGSNILHQSKQKLKTNKTNEFSDWIVDDIHQETNRILSRYTSGKINEITYHQKLPSKPQQIQAIQRKNSFIMQRSNSIQTIKNDRELIRNMSLTSLDTKPRDSMIKNSTLRINPTESRPVLNLNKTQQMKDSRLNISATPFKQNTSKINPSVSMKDLIAQKCKKLSIN